MISIKFIRFLNSIIVNLVSVLNELCYFVEFRILILCLLALYVIFIVPAIYYCLIFLLIVSVIFFILLIAFPKFEYFFGSKEFSNVFNFFLLLLIFPLLAIVVRL